jgi:alkylation response protein AidB-like acyl-CoA dehydrogenase
MQALRFARAILPPSCEQVRQQIRAFLREHLPARSAAQRALSWTAFDAEFSRQLGGHGFLGMTFPRAYGGHDKSALERYVVAEELLAAGAPVAAHWMADRQSGPLLLRFGSEFLKQSFLPRIARGEAYFCIGMSEPDTGSDLASVRTTADRVPGGFRVNGSKLWGTHVTRSPHMIALVRTQRGLAQRHAGLTQLLIDLDGPGITVRPILDLLGHDHFGEVTFDDAFVPEERVIGTEGDGWQQVVAELGLERSGPERFLSSFELLRQLAACATEPEHEVVLGTLYARLTVLRQMSLSIAARLSRGEEVGVEAAVVKELGTTFEQALPHAIHDLLGTPVLRQGGNTLMQVHAVISQLAPSYSLRGGTREILRGIIAKDLLR